MSYVQHSCPYPNFLFSFCLWGTHKTIPGVITPGISLQRTSVTCVGHSYPYPELLEVLYAGATKTRGTGTACLYLPETSASSVRSCHNTWNFWKLCKASIPVPGTSGSSVRPEPHIPGVRVHHVLYLPGTSVSSVCLCHNTRIFRKFCTTSIPVPETSGISVRPPYRYPESTNPTKLKRAILTTVVSVCRNVETRYSCLLFASLLRKQTCLSTC